MSWLGLWVVLAWLAAARCRDEAAGLKGLAAALGHIEERCRAGAVDWRGGVAASDGPPQGVERSLAAVLDRAWREGQPLAGSLAALRRELARGAGLLQAGRGLGRLLLWREALALTAASGVRFYWELLGAGAVGDITGSGVAMASGVSPGPGVSLAWLDHAAVVLAGVLLILAQSLLARSLPRPWLVATRLGASSKAQSRSDILNRAAHAWLAAHLSGEPEPGMDQTSAAALRELEARELAAGVSLKGEKRRTLQVWSRAEGVKARARLKRVEDALPLFELLGVGLPVMLVVLVPLVAALQQR